jgi:ribosomal 50S subunit-recycling heat shock protein
MRIDQFLKLAGLLKSRSLAGKACQGGFVVVNGSVVRSSLTVKPDDRIELTRPDGSVITVEVIEIPSSKQVSRGDRKKLYRILHSLEEFTC